MPRPMLRAFAFLPVAGLLALGACAAPPDVPPPDQPDIRFQGSPPIPLRAASIQFDDQFQPSYRAPQIEQDMKVPPQRAMHNWIADRLMAADTTSPNHIRVVITDARVEAVPLQPTDTGFQASFTKQQTMRYDAHVAMTVQLIDGHGLPVRTATGRAALSRTIGEEASLNDRDALLYKMSRDITASLGHVITDQINATFAPYIQ